MQVEKINENKIEIIISIEDLNKNNISLQSFMSNSTYNKDLLFKILDFANTQIGFNIKNCEVTIEAFSVPSKNLFILVVTRVPENKKKNYFHISHSKYKKLKLYTSITCSFDNFEDFCMFCNSTNNINLKSSLFLLNHTYYLHIKFNHIKDIRPTISSLSEFSSNITFNKSIYENSRIIIKDYAIAISKKYLV